MTKITYIFDEDDRKGADLVAELLRTRSKEVLPSYVGFVRGHRLSQILKITIAHSRMPIRCLQTSIRT